LLQGRDLTLTGAPGLDFEPDVIFADELLIRLDSLTIGFQHGRKDLVLVVTPEFENRNFVQSHPAGCMPATVARDDHAVPRDQ
jgi:hypothetical protein